MAVPASIAHGYEHLMQKVSWLIPPMGELVREHLESLAECPPVQCGKSFDMTIVVQGVVEKSRQ